jgi:ring-1,2-phenylacetyl-CoA epoxidase subunit PaaD
VVSEGQTQVSIARTRAGIDIPVRGGDPDRDRAVPASVPVSVLKPASVPAPVPSTAGSGIDEATVRAALVNVMDPELPMVSIVDLGMIGGVDVADPGPGGGATGGIRVELLPTYIGCPALDIIRAAISDRLAALGLPVAVETTFNPPWTTDRVTAAGRAALNAAGIAEPTAAADVRCPFCRSARIVMDSAFGPTQCRSLYFCRDCHQPFEAMKLV